ncbi:MAG: hypothetical protein IKA79_07050, partial [Lentisphaeria bacterium]|nr:hypothetical protein [Lentisphaeria bacterium]
ELQIVSGSKYREKAARQYVRQIRIPAVRGRIFSSDGKLLAGNRVSYDMVFHISEMRQSGKFYKNVKHIHEQAEKALRMIGRKMDVTEKDIVHRMTIYPGIPMTIARDLSAEELARITEMQPPIQGLEVVPVPRRYYPGKKHAAHLLGYTGISDPGTAEDRREFFYYLPDPVGRAGVEKLCNDALRGAPGKKLVIVDHRGFVHKEEGKAQKAENGSDVILSIDSRAQKIAEDLLQNKRGAITVVDANTGELVAMASSPAYDLNDFIPRISSKKYRSLLLHPGQPFLNRCAFGSYMPGSIIKPIVALAMLENGQKKDDKILCDGVSTIAEAKIKCTAYLRGGHGKLDLPRAIELSCNDYFIDGGRVLGIQRLSAMFTACGIGRKSGFLLSERSGRLPAAHRYPNWNIYDTALVSIGQGKIEITPLQAVLYTAAIANGGTLYKPILVKAVREENGKELFTAVPEKNGTLPVSQATLQAVRQGMYQAVHSSMGSARRANNSFISLCGKTGTAEVGPKNARYKNTWFIGFGTVPGSGKRKAVTYAISILVTHGESGGLTCAPGARAFFERYLQRSDG